MSSRALGLEVSDSVVRAVIVDDTGRVTWRGEGSADPRSVAAQLKPAVKEAGGVAAAGVAHYEEIPEALQRAVSDASGVELRAAGAGIAAATAETWCGAAQGLKHVVALTLGDHIAAGVILNGAPWSGAHGLAGSAAWLAINPVERQDYRRRGIARRRDQRARHRSSSGLAHRVGRSLLGPREGANARGDHGDTRLRRRPRA